jgi:single-stranded DNA-binding protein
MKTPKNNHVKMYVCLGTQPVVRNTSNGKRMANFFAMNVTPDEACPPMEPFRPSTKWFRVISWDAVADAAARHLHKGKKVLLMGNVITQQFKTRKGKIKTKEVIVASSIVLLDSGKAPHMNAA